MKKKLFAGALAVMLTSVFGAAAEEDAAHAASMGAIIDIPQCVDSGGQDVTFRLTDGRRGPYKGFSVAHAVIEDGKPVILLDTNTLLELPQVMPFFIEHECAHHKLGHLLELHEMTRRPTSGVYFRMEHEADCAAARQMKRKHDYGVAEITAIFDNMLSVGDRTHPSSERRLDRALWCIAPQLKFEKEP